MASAPINPTNLTPPRVAFLDPRTGAVSREWYRFFLSLLTATQDNADTSDGVPDSNSLLASYDAMLNQLAQDVQSAPDASAAVASLEDSVNDLAQATGVAPQPPLGTMASVQQDNVRFLGFSTSPSPPVVSGPGVVSWNNADGTLDIGMGYDAVTQQVGLENYFRIKASAAITDGQCVMFTGSVGASGVLTGAPATGVTNGQYIMGVATMDIANNGFGYVTHFGLVRGINTTGSSVGETWADGDILYYNPAYTGGLTKVPPTAPLPKVVVAAVVNAGSGGSGSLFVRVQAEPDLHNLSDVYAPSPISNGQILIGDGPQSRWEAATLTAGTNVSITNAAGAITINATDAFTGTVTSVAMSVPTGFTVSGSPITTSGTLALGFASGYSLPTTASQTNWDTAYSERLQWNGGATNLVAATGRTSLGATTVGSNFFTLTNPSAITFPRINADNSVSTLTASDFRTAIGAGTGNGTVTSVSGTGTVNGITLTGTVTSSGSLTLGGTLSGVSLTTQVTGTLPVANGGTGATTLTGYVKGNGTSAFTASSTIPASDVTGLATVATSGSFTDLSNKPGIQSNGQNVLVANHTLGSADKGTNVLIVTSGITLTFPASGYSSGQGVAVSNVSGGNVTLSAPGGSDFGTTLPNNGTFFAFCDGGGFWRQYCYSTSRL